MKYVSAEPEEYAESVNMFRTHVVFCERSLRSGRSRLCFTGIIQARIHLIAGPFKNTHKEQGLGLLWSIKGRKLHAEFLLHTEQKDASAIA